MEGLNERMGYMDQLIQCLKHMENSVMLPETRLGQLPIKDPVTL
jgi:hypothetical protein